MIKTTFLSKKIPQKTAHLILSEMKSLPEFTLQEILDYVLFIKKRHQKISQETHLLSEESLAKDWLAPEEEAAWKNL